MISSHVEMPQEGHCQQLFHIFAFLKGHHNARFVMDPTYPDIDTEIFPKRDWLQFYVDLKEQKPGNMPHPLGKEILIRAFVDANFAGESIS